jgi:hypothetical protein
VHTQPACYPDRSSNTTLPAAAILAVSDAVFAILASPDDARADFVAHLVAAASEAASAALLAVDDLRRAVANRSTVPCGEIWE